MSPAFRRLRDATKKVAAGDYDIHIENRNKDEIGDLGDDFNIMARKLKGSSEEIDRLEKRRRQFITDVSHEPEDAADDDQRFSGRDEQPDDTRRPAG